MANLDIFKQRVSDGEIIYGFESYPYWIVPSPGLRDSYTFQGHKLGGLNGYVVFKEKPVKTHGYNDILVYVPVHGGITYAEHDQMGSVYGFDTGHCDSHEYPREDNDWIKGQCEVMLRGILLAAELEDKYLLAEGDNEKRAVICQKIVDLAPEMGYGFGVMINLLGGKL